MWTMKATWKNKKKKLKKNNRNYILWLLRQNQIIIKNIFSAQLQNQWKLILNYEALLVNVAYSGLCNKNQ